MSTEGEDLNREVKPVKPEDLGDKMKQKINIIVGVFNGLLTKKYQGVEVKFSEADVQGLLEKQEFGDPKILDKYWPKIKDMFEDTGWIVYFNRLEDDERSPFNIDEDRAEFTFERAPEWLPKTKKY